MAERRMFAKSIIDSDIFLDMPSSTQNLYFHLAMRADDDGFVNSPQRIMRMVSCSRNDMDMLVFKNFVIPFESGVCVISHWRLHNYIRKDRYTPTIYVDERNQLYLDDSQRYTVGQPDGIPLGLPNSDFGQPKRDFGQPDGRHVVDVGKVSIGKVSIDKTREDILSSFSVFEQEGFGTISHYIMQELEELVNEYTDEWVVDAMRESVMQGKRKLSYVKGILKSWKADGRSSSGSSTVGRTQRAAYRQEPKQHIEKEVEVYLGPNSRDGDY